MIRSAFVGMLLSATIPAIASAEPRVATVTVTAADLATPSARAKLDRRIGAAIEEVCGSYAAIESSQTAELDDCWRSATAQAAKRIAEVHGNRNSIQLASH